MSIKVSMKVNGKPVSAEVEARTLLVTYIRENLRLTGTHVGCDTAQCGACTVLMNGRAIKSCSIVAMQAEGADLMTIEGVAKPDGTLHPMQQAFKENHGLQCGFCTPGMVMNALDFAESHPNPDRAGSAREPRGQPLPLHRLPQHREEHHRRRESDGRQAVNAPLIGARVLRKEDYRFLTGAGQYTDDVTLPRPGLCGLRALAARACRASRSINIEKAKKAPGRPRRLHRRGSRRGQGRRPAVRLADHRRQRPADEGAAASRRSRRARCATSAIAVAVVIAETLEQARDAAEKVEVDYEVLPAVVDAGQGRAKGAPASTTSRPDNTCYVWALGDKAKVDEAFAKAAHVTKLDFINNRLIPNAIEPRAANGAYSRADDSYTLYVASQNPHVERLLMTAFVLGLPEHKVRVIAPDVGGGFGSKIYLYAEDVVVTWAAKQLNRPVKWTAERSESFLSDAHGRDHVTTAELALDKDGKFLAMRVKTTANLGAYLSTFASCIPTILYATLLAGQYKTPLIHCEVTAVFTNTTPVDAYRGAGRPEATYVVERLVETAARELKIDPGRDPAAQLHRRTSRTRRRSRCSTTPATTSATLTPR